MRQKYFIIDGCLMCRVCGQSKPISAFKKDNTMATGIRSMCRVCENERQRNYKKKPEQREKAHKRYLRLKEEMPDVLRNRAIASYWRNREEILRRRKERKDSEQISADRMRAYRIANSKNINARNKTRYHLSVGNIKKLPCEFCGDSNVEAHHEDYDNPLNVTWLCHKHHVGRHHYLNILARAIKGKG